LNALLATPPGVAAIAAIFAAIAKVKLQIKINRLRGCGLKKIVKKEFTLGELRTDKKSLAAPEPWRH
jgi:hypothetical protein